MRAAAVERLNDGAVGKLQRLVNCLALDHFRRHGRSGYRRAAAEGFELDIGNDVVVDFKIDAHNIAALGVSDFADGVGVGYFAHVARVHEVVHDLFRIHNIILSAAASGAQRDACPEYTFGRAAGKAARPQNHFGSCPFHSGDMARSFSTMGGRVSRI